MMRKLFTFVLFVIVSLIACGCASSYVQDDEFVFVKGKKNAYVSFQKSDIKSFYICKHEVTQQEWESVMGEHAGKFSGENLPVENISWYMAVIYCNRRSIQEGLTPCYSVKTHGNEIDWQNISSSYIPRTLDEQRDWKEISCDFNANGYRLPTVLEWEYADRNTKTTVYDDIAWYNDNSGNKTHDVMTKAPNDLGIYDMKGNVSEWCWDNEESVFNETELYGSYVSWNLDETESRFFSGTDFSYKSQSTSGGLTIKLSFSAPPDRRNDKLGLRLVRSRF